MTLQIGTRLGHYRIIALLGRGGWLTFTGPRMSAWDGKWR